MKTSLKLLLCSMFICAMSCKDAQLEKNITMYSNVWDEVINKGNLELINDTNFDANITLVSSPENVVGIEAFKAYYSNFTNGFSDIEFTIENIFGQGDNIMKQWNFKGTNTGEFFGMPATGNTVDLSGVTLVKMKDGKIAREQDFMDNMQFMQQLGIVSSPENVEIIDGMYKAFAKGDIPNVLSALDPNIVWNEAENFPYADNNPYIGPDAVLNGVFARVGGDWDNFTLVDLKLHDMSNNYVLATGRYQGKYKKNGASINAQMSHLWQLKDGKAISFQQMVDTKHVSEAINK
ncbi:ester cyclase [Seonamhaeicola maritimus]|uniref:ester cyclase n=1 Tax=Seonamhaeicola maritimus TaxID=2591822 RepID=UPI00249415CB|nr:ester cyclase [Seonamhaeicola maritimus]